MSIGSLPRLRLYTTFGQYLQLIFEFLTGRWRQGGDVTKAEKAIASRVGTKHAVLTNMARVGIYLALKNTIRPGQKVIVSPYTIVDVINMVVCAGGVPVFADLDTDTCNISADNVEELLATQSNVGAVMVTHFYGLACDVARIRTMCEMRGVALLEDAAQAFGVSVQGKAVGTFGRAGIFSFGLYKNVNSFYGGAVVTDDDDLAIALRRDVSCLPAISTAFYYKKVISGFITDVVTWPPLFRIFTFKIFRYGILNDVASINDKLKIDTDPKLIHEIPREYLVQPSAMQARMIVQQLPNVEADTLRRQQHAKRYRDGLAGLPEMQVPPEAPERRRWRRAPRPTATPSRRCRSRCSACLT